MTIRLRDFSKNEINPFHDIPSELTTKILGSAYSKKPLTSYLATIACVCKLWHEYAHDVTVQFLNEQRLHLMEIPYVMHNDWKITPYRVIQYLKFLQGEIPLGESPKRKRKLTALNLEELSLFSGTELEQFKTLFSEIEVLNRYPTSGFDNSKTLPMFRNVKRITLAPNKYSDLCFQYMPRLESLTLHFDFCEISSGILKNCTTISTLHLIGGVFINNIFPKDFKLPSQLEHLTLTHFVYDENIFSASPNIKRLSFQCMTPPTCFKIFQNLEFLSIHCSPFTSELVFKNLKVTHLDLQGASLRKLQLEQTSIQQISLSKPDLVEISLI